MFPISDARGRIIAFGGRGLSADAKPKYINTGETSLFSKGHLLYNFATARAAAIKGAALILAEGYMDVIALVRAGFDGAVAPLGHRADRRPVATVVAHWRPNRSLLSTATKRDCGPAHRAAHLALAASEARLFAALCVSAHRRRSGQLPRTPGRRRRCARCSKRRCRSPMCCGGRNRGQGFLHARTPRRARSRSRRNRRRDHRRQDRRLLPPRLRAARVRRLQAARAQPTPKSPPRAARPSARPVVSAGTGKPGFMPAARDGIRRRQSSLLARQFAAGRPGT